MDITCSACKQVNKDTELGYCSFCYHRFEKPPEKAEKNEKAEKHKSDYSDFSTEAHPARRSFAPLQKRFDLTGPIKTVLVLGLIVVIVSIYLNGGFSYEDEDVYENGELVHIHHFHILPKHTRAPGSKNVRRFDSKQQAGASGQPR